LLCHFSSFLLFSLLFRFPFFSPVSFNTFEPPSGGYVFGLQDSQDQTRLSAPHGTARHGTAQHSTAKGSHHGAPAGRHHGWGLLMLMLMLRLLPLFGGQGMGNKGLLGGRGSEPSEGGRAKHRRPLVFLSEL
jgi:hypothetical protein